MISCYTVTKNPNKEWFKKAKDSVKVCGFDEYIIVDDASSKPVESSTYRISEGHGVGNARNKAIEICRGDIIAMIDDDDYFIPENVEKLKKFIEDNPADVYHFPCIMFGNLTGVWGDGPKLDKLLDENQIPASAWVKKSVFISEKYINDTPEDWDMWIRLYKKRYRFAYFPLPIYYHRMRDGSLSALDSPLIKNYGKIKEDLRNKYETIN